MNEIIIDREFVDCEQCDSELYVGYEVLLHDNTFFCDDDCLLKYIESLDYRKVKLKRSVSK